MEQPDVPVIFNFDNPLVQLTALETIAHKSLDALPLPIDY